MAAYQNHLSGRKTAAQLKAVMRHRQAGPMSVGREIMIAGRIYRRNPEVGRYQIHLDELGDLRMCDIPPRSHLEVLGLPVPHAAYKIECYGLNDGDDGEHEHLDLYGERHSKPDPLRRHALLHGFVVPFQACTSTVRGGRRFCGSADCQQLVARAPVSGMPFCAKIGN